MRKPIITTPSPGDEWKEFIDGNGSRRGVTLSKARLI